MTAQERLIDALRSHGSYVDDDKGKAQCPAHDDGTPSLSIRPRRKGSGVLVYCHAGCDTREVLQALGLTMPDLFDEPKVRSIYEPRRDYRYPGGRIVHRKPGKDFPQSGNRADRSLYGSDKITDSTTTVYVVEGEKDVEAVQAAGGVGVCSAMGAGKAHKADWSPLAGKRVVVIADKDEPGYKHAAEIAELVGTVAASVRIVEPVVGKDFADQFAAGKALDDLIDYFPPNNSATAQPPTSPPMPEIARLPRILDAVADEVRSRGLVGEERIARTLYLVLTSRLLDKQVSAGVKGHSASGKSYTVETVTRFFPPESYLEFTAMSERALVYSTESFAHRTLIVYEITALREGVEDDMTSYFVRSLLSEGRIDYEVTVRAKEGGFTTKKITKKGPTNLIFTTTKTRVHAENETRILSLATDDSREQTARVLLELADESNSDRDLEQWRDLQRWLTNAEHRVTIPYALQLAQQVAPVAVRLRRDFGSVLALIRAHAVLHQASRDRDEAGRIIATLDDYTVVRDLVADTIAEGVGTTVSEMVRDTVAAVAAVASTEGVMARDVAEKLQLDKSNVSRRLRMAADDGYLRNLEDKRGKPGRWVIGDPLPKSADLLPDPAQLATADTTPDLGGCAVALESGGENDNPSLHVSQPNSSAYYINGQCRDGCGRPHSARRPRCDECHRIRLTVMDGYDR